MTLINFSKYTGCGNDFILIDNRTKVVDKITKPLVSQMCNRHRGIGADGVILLETSSHADYKMRIFNADGSEAEMCGNGLRCLTRFIHDKGDHNSSFTIETKECVLKTRIVGELIEIEMGEPKNVLWSERLDVEGRRFNYSFINTGVPHLVHFVDDVDAFDLAYWGPLLRHHPLFAPAGTNVNVVQVKEGERISVRTFERGVEAETLACGTGAVAAALAATLYFFESPVEVEVKSGDRLKISFDINDLAPENIILSGPATAVFDGHFRINSIE